MFRISRKSVCAVTVFLALTGIASHGLAREASAPGETPSLKGSSENPPLWWQFAFDREELQEKNIHWKAALGYSTRCDPVVAEGLIWVGTNNRQPRDPADKQPGAALMCFRATDGKFLYQHLYRAAPGEGLGPVNFVGHMSSPVVEGDRAWFITGRSEVVCLDIAPLRRGSGDPRPLWSLDLRKTLGIRPWTSVMGWAKPGALSAPYQGRIYVLTGNGCDESEDRLPAPDAPNLVCLDSATGKILWRDSSAGKDVLPGQWTSPLVAVINGQAQVIAGLGDGWVRSFDALSGKPVWQFNTNPAGAARAERNTVLATPAFHANRVYVGNDTPPDAPYTPRSRWFYCIDATRKGDISPDLDDGTGKPRANPNSGLVWRFGGIGPNKRSLFTGTHGRAVVAGGLVVIAETSGYVQCLDAATGKPHWRCDMRSESFGSPLVVADQLYVATTESVHRFRLSADPQVAMRKLGNRYQAQTIIETDEPMYATPLFANGTLYLATNTTLYAIRAQDSAPVEGSWPQWRGPGRTNVADDHGLATTWPQQGPPLLWKAAGLGQGVASVAVVGGRVFTLGYRDDQEYATAVDDRTGEVAWQVPLGPAVKEFAGMRWLNQRTPTVDGDRLFAVSVHGELVCLASSDGKEIWRRSYPKDFEGRRGNWGYCDYPLVDGDRLICTPGGKDATVVALDKRNGALIWKCAVPQEDRGTEAAIIVAQIAGTRQYIHQLAKGAVGISHDGKFLWRYSKVGDSRGNVHTALVKDDQILCSNGWGRHVGLIRLVRSGEEFRVEELYSRNVPLDPWLGSSVVLGDHVYTSNGVFFEFKTGEAVGRLPSEPPQRITMCAGGQFLIYRLPDNRILLTQATPKGITKKAEFQAPRASGEVTWSFPVIAGGKLYLRDQDVLLCYDLRPASNKPFREPDAIFVPTPQDVVEKMLELAVVKQGDVLFDLGCGDGRIVVTAAKKYGCRAVGYDLDEECVKAAQGRVKKEKLEALVTIERKDLFAADLKGASVIMLYLGPNLNAKLIPQLEKLKPGSRIVSHAFAMPGVIPDRVVRVVSSEDGVEHLLYFWTTPLRNREE
jgi:outer membrane protein assembly factor BamB